VRTFGTKVQALVPDLAGLATADAATATPQTILQSVQQAARRLGKRAARLQADEAKRAAIGRDQAYVPDEAPMHLAVRYETGKYRQLKLLFTALERYRGPGKEAR